MQRIDINGITVPIHDNDRMPTNHNEFRVGNRVFIATGSHDGKRAKALTESGPNVLNVHG